MDIFKQIGVSFSEIKSKKAMLVVTNEDGLVVFDSITSIDRNEGLIAPISNAINSMKEFSELRVYKDGKIVDCFIFLIG